MIVEKREKGINIEKKWHLFKKVINYFVKRVSLCLR